MQSSRYSTRSGSRTVHVRPEESKAEKEAEKGVGFVSLFLAKRASLDTTMGERKVLNKYFPPDFDPSKLPRRKFDYDAPMGIRMMLPFSLSCLSCGHYMYQGKKFNSKKETAKGMDYLGIKRLRFVIKCEVCNNRISFLTDPKNQDYECESGATRNYSAWRESKQEEQQKSREQDAEMAANGGTGDPKKGKDSMQILESRTLDSKREMDDLEALEQLKHLNRGRSRLDPAAMMKQQAEAEKERAQKEEDDAVELFKLKRKQQQAQALDEEDKPTVGVAGTTLETKPETVIGESGARKKHRIDPEHVKDFSASGAEIEDEARDAEVVAKRKKKKKKKHKKQKENRSVKDDKKQAVAPMSLLANYGSSSDSQ